jgi:hypothetical protein
MEMITTPLKGGGGGSMTARKFRTAFLSFPMQLTNYIAIAVS